MTRGTLWCLLLGATGAVAFASAPCRAEESVTDPSFVVTIAQDVPPPAGPLQNEDKDLEHIPGGGASGGAPAPRTAAANRRIYLENALSDGAARGDLLVPPPAAEGSSWQDHLFADVRSSWAIAERLNATVSDRFTLRGASGLGFPSHENLANDWREGYLSWAPTDQVYLDVGRINLKSGVALGFNPTDFFKTRSVVEPLSSDPTVLREDRLGTAMARAQRVWTDGALLTAFAPALRAPKPVYSNNTLKSLDFSFDRTNDRNRALLRGNLQLIDHWAPEFLVYRDGDQTSFGANMTQGLGQRVIAYLEWAGGKRGTLVGEALNYGRETGALPASAPSPLSEDHEIRFRSDLSLGASYTTDSKVTLNLEFHYSQSGMSDRDWRNWFDAGSGLADPSAVPAVLWYIRAYALEQQQPVSQHYAFVRADWTDALVRNLEITGFVNASVRDGSALAQITADYYVSNEWTIGGLVAMSLGGRHSEFGSVPAVGSVLVKIVRYF